MTESKSDEELVCAIFEDIKKQLNSTKSDTTNVDKLVLELLSRLAKGRAAVELVENLKCCGNCSLIHHHSKSKMCFKARYDEQYQSWNFPYVYKCCDHWQSDQLTQEERK